MINEANALLSHSACQRVIADGWNGIRFWTRIECPVPNGKIADVLGFSYAGDVFIAEVKHTLKASLIENAFNKYARWCNYLYLAVAGIVEADLNRHVPVSGMPQPWHRVGIIGVYPSMMRVLRPPSYRQIGRFDKLEMEKLIRVAADR